MAITPSTLTSALSTTDATSYATASITPTANRLVLLAIESRIAVGVAGGPQTPTATGCGLTWVTVATQTGYSGAGTPNRKITILRAMGSSPSSGAVTIDFNAETQTHCGHSVIEFSDTNQTGTNGSGAIVQTAGANENGVNGTEATVTLASNISDENNITYAWALNTGPATITAGSGFTIHHSGSESEHGTYFVAETKTNSKTANCTWTGNNSWIIISAELAVSPPTRPFSQVVSGLRW